MDALKELVVPKVNMTLAGYVEAVWKTSTVASVSRERRFDSGRDDLDGDRQYLQ